MFFLLGGLNMDGVSLLTAALALIVAFLLYPFYSNYLGSQGVSAP